MRLFNIGAASLAIVGVAHGAVVAAVPTDQISLNIRRQPLESALNEFARQTGLQLLFPADETLERQTAPQVRGEFQIDAGLRQLLGNTGLSYRYVNPKTIAIRRDKHVRLAQSSSLTSVPLSESVDSTDSLTSDEGGGALKEEHEDGAAAKNQDRDAALPEVLIKGSKSLNVDIKRSADDIQPYTIINRETIVGSGAQNVGELLTRKLPSNASAANNSLNPSGVGNVTNIDLRGLGSAQTLILIDGRTAGSYGFLGTSAQADLNSIPLAAIERIEVLPVSASGIYGGKATGGVINVVLRHDYSGLNTSINYSNSFKSSAADSQVTFAGGWGFNGGKTSIQLSGSYDDTNPLFAGERDFYTRGRETALQNNPAFFYSATTPPLGRTSNIRSTTGSNLTLKNGGAPLGSPFTHVPDGYAGPGSDGGRAFVQAAGAYNLQMAETAQTGGGTERPLVSEGTQKTLRLSVRQQISTFLTAFVELSGADKSGSYDVNNSTATFVVPRTASFNPFNQDIRITTPTLGADAKLSSELRQRKVAVGGVFDLPWRSWVASVDYTKDRVRIENDQPGGGISSAGLAAISSGNLNILRDTNVYPVDFGQYISNQAITSPNSSTLDDINASLGGSVATLPGGSIDLTVKLEHQKTKIDEFLQISDTSSGLGILFPPRAQKIDTVYSELRVPIVTSRNKVPGIGLLELQLAGRFDSYESDSTNTISLNNGIPNSAVRSSTNRFDATTPTVGARFSPMRDVMFRASYSEGFLPPDFTQLVPAADLFFPTGLPATVRDPLRGNTAITTPVNVLQGGNSDLRPEESASKAVGLVFTPRFLKGFRLSFDWVRISKRDNISSLGSGQSALDNELFVPGLITRAPAQGDGFNVGPITQINARFLNANRAYVEAYDWALAYSIPTSSWGEFEFDASATQRIHNQRQVTPVAPVIESANAANLSRWAASGSLSWKLRNWYLSWNTQYFGTYWYQTNHGVVLNYASAQAPSALLHDISASYRIGADASSSQSSFLSSVQISGGVKNVFNSTPRLDFITAGSSGIDARQDPRLRGYFLTLSTSF